MGFWSFIIWPAGLYRKKNEDALHLRGNPNCFNVSHLLSETHKMNMDRRGCLVWVEPPPCKSCGVCNEKMVAVCSDGFWIVLQLGRRATLGIERMSEEHGGVTDNLSSQVQAAVPYSLTRSWLLNYACRKASLHRYKDVS